MSDIGIGSGVLTPGSYFEIDKSRATDPFAVDTFKVCILGEHQTGAGGTTPETDILFQRVASVDDAFLKYGNSPSFEMCRSFFRNYKVGVNAELYCISKPTDVSGGVIKGISPKLQLTIPSDMVAGTLNVISNGEAYTVSVGANDLNDDIINRIVSAVNVQSSLEPTASGSALSLVVNWSTIENVSEDLASELDADNQQVMVVVESYDKGPLIAAETAVGGGSYGTAAKRQQIYLEAPDSSTPTAIDLADHIAVIPDEVISIFINPYASTGDLTNYNLLKTELETRFTATEQLEGVQFVSEDGTTANIDTALDGFNEFQTVMLDAGYNRATPRYLQIAALAGVVASTVYADPVIPMMNKTLKSVIAEPEQYKRKQFPDRNDILKAGGAATKVNRNTGTVQTESIVTTYTTNSQGLPDQSYRYLNTVLTASYLRQSALRFIRVNYDNYKLGDDPYEGKEGQRIVTPLIMRASLLAWYKELQDLAIVENYAEFETSLVVVRNGQERLDAIINPDLVNQFRLLGGRISFLL